MGTMKDRSGMNITEAEDIISHLECEVKWVLGSITMNKASGGDVISAELFQILRDDAVKVLHSMSSKFGKLSSSHRTGKVFSLQSQRRTCQRMFKLLHHSHTFHMLAK